MSHDESSHAPAPLTHAVVCASRASALAMTQTRSVAALLARRGVATTILNVTTTGDRLADRPLDALGSENVFVTELESALRDGRAAYAVHSCKDLPSTLPEDMRIVAVGEREDPRDAFCSERYAAFDDLPPGARVGTSSPRRRAQLQSLRPDLRYDDVRGNVDTRLRKLREGHYDAIVLAMAGLNRLKARATFTVPFPVNRIVPAAAQGALAVEMRANGDDALARELRAALNDEATEFCVTAERAALRTLRAGCTAPIGVHARRDGAELLVEIAYAHADGDVVSVERAGAREKATSLDDADRIGAALARSLIAQFPGAARPPRTPSAGSAS